MWFDLWVYFIFYWLLEVINDRIVWTWRVRIKKNVNLFNKSKKKFTFIYRAKYI